MNEIEIFDRSTYGLVQNADGSPLSLVRPEVGKRYITRDGRVTGVMSYDNSDAFHPYRATGADGRKQYWQSSGRWSNTDTDTWYDLVAVYEEPSESFSEGVRDEQRVKDEYYQQFIADMHSKASTYEKEAMKMFIDGNHLHKAHCAMENARVLRFAANIMDGIACSGG